MCLLWEWELLCANLTEYLKMGLQTLYLENLIDLQYWSWVLWVIYPIIISFLLPLIIVLFVYGSVLFLHIYRHRHRLKDAYAQDFWRGARHTLAAFWDAQGRIWHGYEIIGLEKIPEDGPALIIYYHGAIPIDFYYVMAKCVLHRNRHIRAVGDRFLFNIPGFRLLLEALCVTPGTVQSCVNTMVQDGHLLAIAPGGVREAYFSDEYYTMQWGKRCGFAKIALEAKVPIIPMFTQNCREAFRALSIGRRWLRKIYEKTRLPIVPIYGAFPVKMRTFIGDPIPYDSSLNAEQLAGKVQLAIQDLIECHQRIPGTIWRALLQRFSSSPVVENEPVRTPLLSPDQEEEAELAGEVEEEREASGTVPSDTVPDDDSDKDGTPTGSLSAEVQLLEDGGESERLQPSTVNQARNCSDSPGGEEEVPTR